MIKVSQLKKSYKSDGRWQPVVDGVDFHCRRGEYLSIMGHSGSGKTTFLSLLGGLTRPDSGEIMIDAVSLLTLSDRELAAFRNRKLNFIFQFASLIPTLTVRENILLPAMFRPAGSAPDPDLPGRATELLDLVGLADKQNSYPAQLSGGQQRRVAIARAFINAPEIVLADEPTGDLDQQTEEEIIQLFRRMNQEQGVTLIVVTHSETVATAADRRLRMVGGRFAAS